MDMETEVTLCPTPSMDNCSWLLVDVAGTTTSIEYVKDTLYPLVYSEITNYLKSRANQPEIQRALKNLSESRELDADAAGELVKSLTRQDSDNEDLKTIQGYLYRHFYDNGELEGHVFDDVREAFEKWATTRHIAIFSSSSVETQKMHFSNSACGNLTPHISKYFDLKMGSKVDAGTYDKITKYLGVKPEEVVYLTDCPREAAAARSAGLGAFIVIREGNAELPKEALRDFPAISSFSDLPLDKAAKRKIGETSGTEEPPSKVTKVEDSTESKPEESNEPQVSMEVDASNEVNAEKTELPERKEETDIVIDEKSEVAADTKTEICNEPAEVKPTEEASVEKDKVEEEVKAESEKEQVVSNGEQESTEAKLASDDVQTETETKTDDKTDKTEDVQEEVKSADEVKNVDEAKNTDEIKNADEAKNGDVIEQENPDAAKNGESMEQENADVVKTGESIEQENPDAAKNGESVEQKNSDAAKNGESVEPENADEAKNVESIDQENADTIKSVELVEQEEPEKTVATASEVSEEQAETSSEIKTDEKENKSDLANVIENGNKLDETENNSESKEREEETKTDDVAQEPEDADVKVKKLEETAESKTVSVEV